ncbi:potassium/sodium hyperpolarization-activated cyclic nucleotide-gated channel 1-like [Bombyx mandarina]|uniref:Potassium/sodium hyperpolarization-activated cyclic nucleotide-gated channel 1-like n=1 Tax=Bombyx mandarina TaxID=7092 RepID=A0A6J2JLJ6_BOMMA|nr:potassium/sodium hyperpolarization-activated cyclic nucleotide-gated channel 1-like [Bombyx mandarina]
MFDSSLKHACMLPKPPHYLNLYPTAGFLKRQIYKYRNLTLPVEWHHGSAQFIRSQMALRLEWDRQVALNNWLIWHPYSTIKFYWDFYFVLITFAAMGYMPMQVFHGCPDPYDYFILYADAIAFINVIICFITGYLDEGHKKIILEPKLIIKQYLKTNFIFDLIGCLPLQMIQPFHDCRYPSHTIFLIFKLFRLVSLDYQSVNLLNQLGLSYITKEFLSVVVQIVMFFHWMAYIHYQMPAFCVNLYAMDDYLQRWMNRFAVNAGIPMFQKYTINLFYVCSLCVGAGYYTPLEGHSLLRMIQTTAISLTGLIFLTYAFMKLLRLTMYQQFEVNVFYGRYKELRDYMNLKKLPTCLQRKIDHFINYKYNGHYFNERHILDTINEQIKQDINMYSCKTLMNNVPLFRDMPVALINSMIFSLKRKFYMPGQMVVKYGQPGRSFYLISSGTLTVLDSKDKEMAHLRDGSYFGEGAILRPGILRKATIIALEITEIYKFTAEDFQECLRPYPHYKKQLEETAARAAARSQSS